MNWWIRITGEKRLTRQNRSTGGKNSPNATLSTTNPISIGIRLNAVLRAQKHTTETTRAMVRPVYHFIRRFAHLRKVNINSVMSVRLQATSRLPLDGFSWNFVCEYFFKICRENSRFIKICQEERVLYVKNNTHIWSYLTQFFLAWEMFQTKLVEKIKTNILRLMTLFFRKLCRFWGNVDNYWRIGQVTDDNIVRCMRFAC
jgi:hypothetical protein